MQLFMTLALTEVAVRVALVHSFRVRPAASRRRPPGSADARPDGLVTGNSAGGNDGSAVFGTVQLPPNARGALAAFGLPPPS
jgi:hypothetical protein